MLNRLMNKESKVKIMGSALAAATLMIASQAAQAADMQTAVKKYNAKQYQAALNDFKELSRAKPSEGLYHYYLALCNQCLARVGEAKLEYQKVIDSGHPSLRANAQAGLSQLEKVSVRTGGGGAAAPAASTANDVSPVVTSAKQDPKDPVLAKGKDKKDELAEAKKKLPAIKQIIMFYSDSSSGSAAMEATWDEAKLKYKDIEFTRLNVADNANAEMVAKYGVNAYPTTVMIDQAGKAVHNQAGAVIGEAFGSTIDSYLKKK